MESSRIFVRGLPPTMTEADFKKHFSTTGSITDTKLFANRRIGHVGYENAEQAEKSVKYFNKTFIRMSKLAVELARPVADSPAAQHQSRSASGRSGGPAVSFRAEADTQASTGTKRKRGSNGDKPADPKLQEFLSAMKKGPDSHVIQAEPEQIQPTADALFSDDSDDDIQTISKKPKQEPTKEGKVLSTASAPVQADVSRPMEGVEPVHAAQEDQTDAIAAGVPSSDSDWLRSRTNRLLDITTDAEVPSTASQTTTQPDLALDLTRVSPEPTPANEEGDAAAEVPEPLSETESNKAKITESKRLFLRNLSYKTTEDDLRKAFSSFASLVEVHVPIDPRTGQSRGLAYILFDEAVDAVNAWEKLDGTTLNGRLLHVLPASAKRETQLDDYTLSKLPLKKQQQIKKKREAATTTFNWNSLFMNADAVMSSVADRLGVDKSVLLDPTSSDAAVKQAHAETHVIQETKSYFKSQGVNLDSFTKKKRGDTAILVKNFPYDSKAEELRGMFEQHGKLRRFLMPPTGTIAIVEFENAPEARAAFSALAYRKIKTSVLFLEKAPADLFSGDISKQTEPQSSLAAVKPTAGDLLEREHEQQADNMPTATLFVRNLDFSTTTKRLDEVFRPIDGFLSAKVKTKTDPKKPGQVLSMGFGFLEFRTKEQAQSAQSAMDGYRLDGHDLQIRASHKGHDAAEQRKQEDSAKKQAAKRSKLLIKNLPFEATKKDLRSLFGAYGQLRSVRLPKKLGQSTRGFAFAEFTTPKEAESAMDALRNTHLLGRRLVIDYAAEDPEDAEEQLEKMQSKMGSQLNKVAVQNLMGDGRKKFTVSVPGDEDS